MGERTLRGMFWAYGSYVGGRALVMVSVAILARLLTPADFGLVAFALTVTALLDTLADLGVSQALIVIGQDDSRDRASTAWTLSMLIGVALTLLTIALAPLVALFFDEPELVAIVAALGFNFLIRASAVTHFALAQKRLDFRARTIAEMADVGVRAATGIGLALAGAGAWSLVIGYLAGTTARAIALWLLVDFRPRPHVHRADARALLRFGGGLAALDVISAIVANMDYVFVGRVLGKTELGLYTIGFRLPELLIMNLSIVAGVVLFPAFAGIDRGTLGRSFLVALRFTLGVAAPLAVALVVFAEPIVLAVFGDQWVDAVPVVRVLSLFAFAVAVGIPAGSAYKAIGRVDVLLKLAVPRALLAVGSIAWFVDEGITAVAACQAAVAGLFAVIGILLASHLLGAGLPAVLRAIAAPVAAAALMAAVAVGIALAVDGPWLTLLLAGPASALTYVLALWRLAPDIPARLLAAATSGRTVTA